MRKVRDGEEKKKKRENNDEQNQLLYFENFKKTSLAGSATLVDTSWARLTAKLLRYMRGGGA